MTAHSRLGPSYNHCGGFCGDPLGGRLFLIGGFRSSRFLDDRLQGVSLGLHTNVAVVFEHLFGDVTSDVHDGLVARAALSQIGYGHIWIELHQHDDLCTQHRCGNSEYLPRVIIDANDLFGDFEYWSKVDGGNNLANLMIPEDWKNWYGRILAYWHNKGCPVIDRKAPGFDAPWFAWNEAGFTEQEHNECIQEMLQLCR